MGEEWALTLVLTWIVAQRLSETMDTDSSCGNGLGQFWPGVWGESGVWLQRLDKATHKCYWQGKAGATIRVTTYRKCSAMWGCEREGVGVLRCSEDGTEACPSLQRICPITPVEWGPSPAGHKTRGAHWPLYLIEKKSVRVTALVTNAYLCKSHTESSTKDK